MAIQYGIIPQEDIPAAETIIDIITIPAEATFTVKNVTSGTITDISGQVQDVITVPAFSKTVEHGTWSAAQTNFVNARWNAFFAANTSNVRNFITMTDQEFASTLGDVLDNSGLDRNWLVLHDITGTFQVGETISHSTPSRSATILEVDGNKIRTNDPTPNDFNEDEAMLGETSGATGTLTLYFPRI